MNNPERILSALNRHLNRKVELVLFGRGAIAIGFPDPPRACGTTLDVDCIIELSRKPPIEEEEYFWEALEIANSELQPSGLYMSHLFGEEQVTISREWYDRKVDISRPSWDKLILFRPSTPDLVCTKMMRGLHDEEDLADIRFMLSREHVTKEELRRAFDEVRIPEIEEFRFAFEAMRPVVLEMATT